MNSAPINWLAAFAMIVVWAMLLRWALGLSTATRNGLVLKSLAVGLLVAFGGMMLWNIYVIYSRQH